MHRDILLACLPYLAAIVGSMAVLWLLIRLSGARFDKRQLRRLHRDERGAVQSFSFVMTLPIFILVMLFVIQLSQLTIAKIVVEYAAFATARSAIVWIPANLGPDYESENKVSLLAPDEERVVDDQRYAIYDVVEGGPKYNKIHFAAAMACMPICPSRDVGADRFHEGNEAADSLIRAYYAASPEARDNPRVPDRIRNKLAYALENTDVAIKIWHKEDEPPLNTHLVPPYLEEFVPMSEIGWQDQIVVTVTHRFALLPGPARLLFESEGSRIRRTGGVYWQKLSAQVRLSNEGEKPLLPHYQETYNSEPPTVRGEDLY